MKSKIYLFGLVLTLVFSLSACKSKQSAYKQVYEAAQARSTVEAEPAPAPTYNTTPVERTKPKATGTFQSEKLTAVDGSGIKQFSVVIGSFINKTNAESLKSRMQAKGFSPVLALNDKNMYRVIVATFDNKPDAYDKRDEIRDNYPEFSDAWLLERAY
ncbi:cell division protein [Bacteroidia bacterium]|nr:cell division protein [Bacteroidia bacterium]